MIKKLSIGKKILAIRPTLTFQSLLPPKARQCEKSPSLHHVSPPGLHLTPSPASRLAHFGAKPGGKGGWLGGANFMGAMCVLLLSIAVRQT